MSTQERPGEPDPVNVDAAAAVPEGAGRSGRRAWIFAIVAGIVAGIVALAVAEGVLAAYKTAFEPISKPYPSAEDNIRIARARIVSGTLILGATGAVLGLALGLAGGASRRSAKASLSAGLAGLVVGGLGEAGAAYAGLTYIYTKMDLQSEEMLPTLLGHEALWAVVGLAGGLAFGLGFGVRGAWWRAAVGGLAGAAIATVAYEIIGALAFPTHGTHQPFGDSTITRALAQILIPLGAALGAAGAAGGREGKPRVPHRAG